MASLPNNNNRTKKSASKEISADKQPKRVQSQRRNLLVNPVPIPKHGPVDKRKSKRKNSKEPETKREKFKIGDVVGMQNKWRILALLGSGSFSDVYKVKIEGEITRCDVVCDEEISIPADEVQDEKGGSREGSRERDSGCCKDAVCTCNCEDSGSERSDMTGGTQTNRQSESSNTISDLKNFTDFGQPQSPSDTGNEARRDAGAEKHGQCTKRTSERKRVQRSTGKEKQSQSVQRVLRLLKIEKDQSYALKTEDISTSKLLSRLKIEMKVLLKITFANPERKRHFGNLFDRGKTSTGKYLVMTLLGDSLDELRRSICKQGDFHPSTTMQIALQTLKSIEDLHWIGYIHRDIKPNNFACGIGDNQDIIYMLDFGVARKIYKTGTKELRKVRKSARLVGTLFFCSRASMYCVEQGRKDDLESWLYMLFFLFDNERGIPWRRARKDHNEILKRKELFFKHEYEQCDLVAPKGFRVITDYVNSLNLSDTPDYKLIRVMLTRAAEQSNISLTAPLQWIGAKKASKEKDHDEDSSNSQDHEEHENKHKKD